MNVQHKLEIFSETALREAKERRKLAEHELKARYDEACGEIEAKAAKTASEYFKDEKNALEQKLSRETITLQTEAKKEFVKLRAELTDKVFDAVSQRVSEFKKSEEYDKYMLYGINKVIEEYGTGITVVLCGDDMRLKAIIDSRVTVEEAERGFIGGFKVLVNNTKIVVNNTLETKLDEARSEFRLNGGFLI